MQDKDENDGSIEFRVCRKCGYTRGFHVYFKEFVEGKIKIGLICPSCGQSYDIGWITSDISGIKIKDGERFD